MVKSIPVSSASSEDFMELRAVDAWLNMMVDLEELEQDHLISLALRYTRNVVLGWMIFWHVNFHYILVWSIGRSINARCAAGFYLLTNFMNLALLSLSKKSRYIIVLPKAIFKYLILFLTNCSLSWTVYCLGASAAWLIQPAWKRFIGDNAICPL